MTPGATGPRAKIRQLLTRDERAAKAFEWIGALTWADKLDLIRTDDEILSIPLPLGPGQLRAHRAKMYSSYGRDLAVLAIQQNGWKGFEQPTPEVLVRLVREFPGVLYDVGANSGIYALLAVEARPGTRVVCFEPFPPALAALRANVAMNRFGSHIEVVAAAVDSEEGEATLYVPTATGALETSASLDGNFKEEIEAELKVPMVALDDYWIQAGRPRVSIVKIDVETTEHRVLEGCRSLVGHERPIIIFEVLPQADIAALRAFGSEFDLVDVRMTVHKALVGPEVVHDPRGWNHLYVPREHIDRIVRILTETGLDVSFDDAWPSR